jgi:hypothetical protein
VEEVVHIDAGLLPAVAALDDVMRHAGGYNPGEAA